MVAIALALALMEEKMTTKKKPHWGTYLALVILLAGTIGLVVLQVASANSATKTESALYSVLQFLFSLAFAWVLTRIVTEQQFVESQRKFAIGAFRRIREIERSLNRTQKYLANAETQADRSAGADFMVIRAGLLNAQDAVRSSIADWADIIGDEIEVTNEIRRLKQLKSEGDEGTVDADLGRRDDNRNPPTQGAMKLEERIVSLANALPAEIRADLAADSQELDGREQALDEMGEQWKQDGFLELYAFWEPSDSFTGKVDDLKVGDAVYVARGMTAHRNGVFLAYDANGQTVGVITNQFGCSYDDFVGAFEEFYDRPLLPKYLGGAPLTATVSEIEDFDLRIERQYFRLHIRRIPEHHSAYEGTSGVEVADSQRETPAA